MGHQVAGITRPAVDLDLWVTVASAEAIEDVKRHSETTSVTLSATVCTLAAGSSWCQSRCRRSTNQLAVRRPHVLGVDL